MSSHCSLDPVCSYDVTLPFSRDFQPCSLHAPKTDLLPSPTSLPTPLLHLSLRPSSRPHLRVWDSWPHQEEAQTKRWSSERMRELIKPFPRPILIAFPLWAKSCLALPCLALPCLALPRLALPRLVLPCLALPCLALPYLASPCLALLRLALPLIGFISGVRYAKLISLSDSHQRFSSQNRNYMLGNLLKCRWYNVYIVAH